MPCFAGYPPWDLEEASKLLRSTIQTPDNLHLSPPLLTTFKHALRRRKHKALGSNHIAADGFQWLPCDLQWGLYMAISLSNHARLLKWCRRLEVFPITKMNVEILRILM